MRAKDMSLIALSGATDDHRQAVQTIVTAHTDVWWHHFPDFWIVAGQRPRYWGRLISPVLALSSASVLVLRLPEDSSDRHWYIQAAENEAKKAQWLHDSYFEAAEEPKE